MHKKEIIEHPTVHTKAIPLGSSCEFLQTLDCPPWRPRGFLSHISPSWTWLLVMQRAVHCCDTTGAEHWMSGISFSRVWQGGGVGVGTLSPCQSNLASFKTVSKAMNLESCLVLNQMISSSKSVLSTLIDILGAMVFHSIFSLRIFNWE